MTAGTPPVPDESRQRARRDWPLLAALSATQTIGYGVLYYAFSVLLAPMATELNSSTAGITTALAIAAIVAAASAVPVGRWLDRHGGRGLMTAGAVLGCVAVVAWSQVHTLMQFYLVFALIGLAEAMMLYEPAFAVVIRRVEPARRATSLLTITIVAGLASSIFLPLTGLLLTRSDWRHALLLLACLLAIAIPLHVVAVPGRRAGRDAIVSMIALAHARRAALHDRGFWLLMVAFGAHAGAVAVIAVHLVTYLMRLGHQPTFAATAAGLLGALSVTGRLVTTRLGRRRSTTTVTATVFVLQAVAIALLPIVGRTGIGAIACVAGFGIGFGVSTIARPALLADRYGITAYAAIAGTLALPAILTGAAAPVAAALVIGEGGGYPIVIASVAIACVAAAVMLWFARGRADSAVRLSQS